MSTKKVKVSKSDMTDKAWEELVTKLDLPLEGTVHTIRLDISKIRVFNSETEYTKFYIAGGRTW